MKQKPLQAGSRWLLEPGSSWGSDLKQTQLVLIGQWVSPYRESIGEMLRGGRYLKTESQE